MTDLIVRELDGEFVALDPDSLQAHALTGVAADEYRAATSEGISRRSALKRAGLVAAGACVASIALPVASAAASVAVTVTSVTPSIANNGTSTPVTITGTGFVSAATVSFVLVTNPGGTAGTLVATGVTVVNSTTITATFTSSGFSSPGSSHKAFPYQVRVTNPDTSTGISAGTVFSVQT